MCEANSKEEEVGILLDGREGQRRDEERRVSAPIVILGLSAAGPFPFLTVCSLSGERERETGAAHDPSELAHCG